MATEESPSGGSTLVGDPVVPILDIPPSEDLQPSPETLAAVVAATGPIAPTGPPVVLPSPAEPAIEGGGTSTTVTVEEDRTEDGATTTTTTTTTTTNSPLAGQDGDLEKAGEEAAAATTTVTEERVSVSVAPTVEGIPAEEGAPAAEPGDEGLVTETDVVTVTKTVTVTETSLVAEEDVPMEEPSALGKRGIEDGPADGEALAKKAKELEPVQLGPKTFKSGVEMFNYFYDLLHGWLANVDVNRYEKMVLQDLIGKGHRDPGAKVGAGIKAFQVRFHPGWHSRCFYLVRTDGSVDDFSYRKCVDKLMPLPENMFTSSGDLRVNKLVGSEDDKWGRKGKGKGNSGGGGGGRFGGGKHSRGRRGGGRGGRWSR